MDRIEVGTPSQHYDVLVGSALIARIAVLAGDLVPSDRVVVVVTDANVHALHGKSIERALHDREIAWHVIEPGETAKSWRGLEALNEWLLKLGIGRDDHIIAFGGGVVGDLAGFAAAIHKRGCGFIQVPTSLLAQVDSSVGGKTAINSAEGKNMVGAFHQPALVLADVDLLDTLPMRELRAGFAEVIKYGLLGDSEFFDWCSEYGAALLEGDKDLRAKAVAHCVRSKATVVAADETERGGQRALLNLGHTFGHALEAATGFSDRLLHGEAVALGMVLAAKYSARRGFLVETAARQVEEILRRSGLPSALSALTLEENGSALVNRMLQDKKAHDGKVPLVLLRGIGAAFLEREVELEDVAAFLDEELQAH